MPHIYVPAHAWATNRNALIEDPDPGDTMMYMHGTVWH